MTDRQIFLDGYRGHVHGRTPYSPTPVIELDGAPVTVCIDRDEAVLWVCDLRGGECVSRRLDLEAAGPDDDWYVENGYWDEEDEEDDDEFPRRRVRVDTWNIAEMMTVTHLDGQPVVVTGGARYDFSIEGDDDTSGGIVRAWDLRTGRRTGKVMIGHDLAVCSLTTVPYERGRLAVSSCEAGTLLAWDLAGGEQVAELQGSYNGEMAAASVDGRAIAVTGGDDHFLEMWDLLAGEQIGMSLTGLESGVRALTIATVEDRAVVTAGGDDAKVHVWDLATQEPVGAPLTGHTEPVGTLDTATVGGRTLLLTGNDDGRVGDGTTRVWDLARGEQIGKPLSGHHLQTVTRIDGRPIAVTADDHGAIHLLDLMRFVQ